MRLFRDMLSLFSGGEGTASLPHREAAQPVSGDKERDPGPLSPGPALSLRPGCPETPPLRVAQRALSYPEPSITVIKPCIEDFSLMSNSGALRGAPASVETPRSRLLGPGGQRMDGPVHTLFSEGASQAREARMRPGSRCRRREPNPRPGTRARAGGLSGARRPPLPRAQACSSSCPAVQSNRGTAHGKGPAAIGHQSGTR